MVEEGNKVSCWASHKTTGSFHQSEVNGHMLLSECVRLGPPKGGKRAFIKRTQYGEQEAQLAWDLFIF